MGDLFGFTGLAGLSWGNLLMILIGIVLIYLAIAKDFEPLLLIGIGFGIIIANLPFAGLMETRLDGVLYDRYVIGGQPVGIMAIIFTYLINTEMIPCFIFLGLGAMTDFGPMLANPISMVIGWGAQFGVYFAFFCALLLGFTMEEAASIGIIGGADGPTTIFLTTQLAPQIIGITAVSVYSYMALVPVIQPPIVKLLTSKAERMMYMKPQLRPVSRLEKIIFPILGGIIILLLVPKAAPLLGTFMFGNLLRECGVTKRLADTAENAFMDICTILLTFSIGLFMAADNFLTWKSLEVFVLGVVAFGSSTAFGVIVVKILNLFLKNKINPIIGAAGVSAVPMSARVVQRIAQKANPRNFLLMHAMGPNVAGVIGTALCAGLFIAMLK